MQVREVEIGVVLLDEPHGQLRETLRDGPHRIPAPGDVHLGADDAIRSEVARLQILVILAPLLLELLVCHPVKIQVNFAPDDHRLAVTQLVDLSQVYRRHAQPVSVVSERLGGRYDDRVVLRDRVVGRIGVLLRIVGGGPQRRTNGLGLRG